jgi:beta-galactosidase
LVFTLFKIRIIVNLTEQGYGIVMYSANLPTSNVNKKVLSIPGIRDRAYIQIGNKFVGVLDRLKEKLTINLVNNTFVDLRILVENSGRLNYGNNLLDTKVL